MSLFADVSVAVYLLDLPDRWVRITPLWHRARFYSLLTSSYSSSVSILVLLIVVEFPARFSCTLTVPGTMCTSTADTAIPRTGPGTPRRDLSVILVTEL